MDATLWTGDGSSTRTISGINFQPDFIWTKSRSIANYHNVYDSVRGFGTAKSLNSNSTDSEGTYDKLYGYISAATASGFSVANGTDGSQPNAYTNQNGITYVGWQWKKGAAPGFDIVTYTGNGTARSINHSLGVAPKFIIVKDRSAVNPWPTYHASLGVQYYTLLNTTDASYNNLANYWGSTAPTSTVFNVNTYGGNNTNGDNYVAYLFAEIPGFSKFGSYTGNGSTDGPFVYCGFRPKYVMYKRTDTTGDWIVHDAARNTYNLTNNLLYPNKSDAEVAASGAVSDFTSNGFKLRGTSPDINGGTVIFAAFAESPMKYSLAR